MILARLFAADVSPTGASIGLANPASAEPLCGSRRRKPRYQWTRWNDWRSRQAWHATRRLRDAPQRRATTSGLAISAVLVCAAVGFASPASAQLGEGSYTWTITGGGPVGLHSNWVLNSCDQKCMTIHFSNGETMDVHLQGNAWTGTGSFNGCAYTIDNGSLAGSQNCPDGTSTKFQLTINN